MCKYFLAAVEHDVQRFLDQLPEMGEEAGRGEVLLGAAR